MNNALGFGMTPTAAVVSGDYVAAMEDVLDVYEQPYDPQRPVVCFDETPSSADCRSASKDLEKQGREGSFSLIGEADDSHQSQRTARSH